MQAPPPGPEQLTTQLDALDTGVQKVVEDFQAAVIEGRAERWEPATLDAVAARVRQHSGRLRAYVEFYVARAVSSQGRVSKARDDLRAFVAVMDPKRHLWAPCLLCRSLFADLARTAGDMHEAITVLRAAPPIDLALLDLAAADEQQREQLSAWSELQGVWCELLRQEGRFRAASEHLAASERAANAAGDAECLHRVMERRSEIYLATNRPGKAKEELGKCLAALDALPAERSRPSRQRVDVALLLAVAEFALDERDSARNLLLALRADPHLSSQHKAEVEVRLLDQAMRTGNTTEAAEHLERCVELGLVGQSRTAVRVAALGALLARTTTKPGASADQPRARQMLADVFRRQLDEWRRLPPDPGGFSFLHQAPSRLMLSELIHARLSGDEVVVDAPAGADAVTPEERALVPLLEMQACSALARRKGAVVTDVRTIVRAVVPLGGGILVYLPSLPHSHVFALTEKSTRHWFLPSEDELQVRCRQVVNRLVGLSQAADADDAVVGASLRQDLSAAREMLLPDDLATLVRSWTCLTVVGADLLGDLPFEVLPLDAADNTRLLGEVLPIDQLPSLPWAVASRRAVVSPADKLPIPWVTLLACTDPRVPPLGLVPFPLVRKHLEFLDEVTSPQALVSEAATLAAFASARPTPILHFLAHEAARDDELRGGITLYDGPLWHESLANTRADICILSVCRAGASERRLGEGTALTSLGGALLAAGAQAVVQSRDNVRLQEHLELLKPLYQHLGQRVAPSVALQRARLALVDRGSFVARVRRGQMQVIGLGQWPW